MFLQNQAWTLCLTTWRRLLNASNTHPGQTQISWKHFQNNLASGAAKQTTAATLCNRMINLPLVKYRLFIPAKLSPELSVEDEALQPSNRVCPKQTLWEQGVCVLLSSQWGKKCPKSLNSDSFYRCGISPRLFFLTTTKKHFAHHRYLRQI